MKKHIVFTGGGTGGHVYPALAVIEKLNKYGYKISWIGSRKGIEYKIISNKGIDFYSIPCGKLRRYFSLRNFVDLFKIFFGFIKSLILLKKLKADLIFSKGGYVTVPPIVAAKFLKIRSVTHESDFDPGLATRLNSKFVENIYVPYKETKEMFSQPIKDKVKVTGNPVRNDFFKPDKEKGLKVMGFKDKKPVILVLGGSLGAKEINDLMLSCKDELTKKYSVYHQMGEKNFTEINEDHYITKPFIHENMADIIKAADIVISRSGAGAIWEFITVGTPSILIPLTAGSRGDQLRNANYFKEKGVAFVLHGKDVVKDNLLSILEEFFYDGNKYKMEEKAKELGRTDCAENICSLLRGML